jgi:hypothetical protein
MDSFNEDDIKALTSDDIGYVVIDNPFQYHHHHHHHHEEKQDHHNNDILDNILNDVMIIRSKDNDHYLKSARMGSDNIWDSNYFRGDSSCWVTPKLCKDLGLTG